MTKDTTPSAVSKCCGSKLVMICSLKNEVESKDGMPCQLCCSECKAILYPSDGEDEILTRSKDPLLVASPSVQSEEMESLFASIEEVHGAVTLYRAPSMEQWRKTLLYIRSLEARNKKLEEQNAQLLADWRRMREAMGYAKGMLHDDVAIDPTDPPRDCMFFAHKEITKVLSSLSCKL